MFAFARSASTRCALPRCLALFLAACGLCACPRYGIIDDGTSVSYGPSNDGFLLRPNELPHFGQGYEIPRKWWRRGLRYGTDEMIALVVHTGRQVSQTIPGVVLQIADLSRAKGGPSRWHRSHQTGRDVDILFIVHDAKGALVKLDDMEHFGPDGALLDESASGKSPARPEKAASKAPGKSARDVYFDVERNWILVRTLMENPIAEVQQIFIYQPLAQLLVDHARARGEPEAVIAQASVLLRQPVDSAPHDDHMHVRIYCERTDRDAGCRDRGALRWTKKDYKYDASLAETDAGVGSVSALLAPLPAMMALQPVRVWP